MKNRNSLWLLCIAALSLAPLPARADRGSRENEGVPFQLLQQRIDALRLRVEALEAARAGATAQSCQPGQFVAAVSAAGVIVCAAPATTTTTTAGGGTGAGGGTTTPPGPVTDAYRAALQQAFSALSAKNVPLAPQVIQQVSVLGAPFLIPTAYDLTIGTVVFAQDPAAATATITVAIPNFVLYANGAIDPAGATIAGALTLTASPAMTAVIAVIIESTPSGKHRLGAVSAISVQPVPVTGTGFDSFVASQTAVLLTVTPRLSDEVAGILGGIVPPALASLPEF